MWSILGVAFVLLLMKLSKLYVNLPYLTCRDVWQRWEKVGNFKKVFLAQRSFHVAEVSKI